MTAAAPDIRAGIPAYAADLWAETILGHDDPELDWFEERVDARDIQRWDIDSVLRALDHLKPFERANFDRDRGRVPVARCRVPVSHDTKEACTALGSYLAYDRNGQRAIVWLERDGVNATLFCAATTDAFRDELLDTIESLALGECSTWRGQAVQIDPGEPRGFTHLIPHQPEPPAATLADGLRRNLVVPLRQFETLGAHVPRRGVLLHGRPGTGKSWAIGWVISQVLGPVSVIVATPSVVGNGPFMRGAFEMAATAAPALLVLEDLDVGAGHRMLSASAFGEILNAMDGPGRLPGVFVAATTNHLELLDPALSQRPGRFDVTLEAVEAPDDVRRRAVEAIAAELGVPDDEVTDVVARTKGYSMAEIAAIGQMAWLVAADTGEAPSLTTALTTLAAESPMVVADRLESGYV